MLNQNSSQSVTANSTTLNSLLKLQDRGPGTAATFISAVRLLNERQLQKEIFRKRKSGECVDVAYSSLVSVVCYFVQYLMSSDIQGRIENRLKPRLLLMRFSLCIFPPALISDAEEE